MNNGTNQPDEQQTDREITTLAILKVNAENEHLFIDSYLPFVYHCLVELSARVVSAPQLKAEMQRSFGIKLPQAVLHELLERADQDGKLRHRNGIYEVIQDQLAGCSLTTERESVRRGYHQLLDAIVDFARSTYKTKWDIKDAEHAFTRYVDGFSSGVLACALAGQDPPQGRDLASHEFVIHRFVAYIQRRDQSLFQFLESVVKGRMLADALYFEPKGPLRSRQMRKVEVYFDGPVLLRMLGHAGPEMRAPAIEMLDMLKKQEAILRCFEHSVEEAREILEAAAKAATTGEEYRKLPGDVVAYLVGSGRSRTEIGLLADRLERDLLKIGIQAVPAPERRQEFQIDEQRLERKLGALSYGSRQACLRDIDSLASIHSLRRGRSQKDFANCGAVFVTHNYKLFKVSARFFQRKPQERVVPHCVDLQAFTVLVWLQEPIVKPDLPRDRIIADAYAALNPSPPLWQRYNEEIERVKTTRHLTSEDLSFLRFSEESRVALMDLTRGDPRAFTEGTLDQIRTRSREVSFAAVQSERDNLQAELQATTARLDGYTVHLTRIADAVSKGVSNLVFVLTLLALTIGLVLGPHGVVGWKLIPSYIQYGCWATAVILAFVSVVHRSSLIAFRAWLEGYLRRRITALLLRIVESRPRQLSADPSPR